MENRANYALVGLFATLAVAALLGFIYWFVAADSEGEQVAYEVVFEGSVTGLSAGTDVLFNGLRVGTVGNVRIDPEDPNQVLARILVDAEAPVKADTQAILEIQGLTGGAYIQLLGGSPEAPDLAPSDGRTIAILRGEPSDLQTIVEGAGEIVASAESAFARIDSFLGANEQRLSTTLANIEALSNSLAGFATDAGEGNGMEGMVASLQETIESANATFGRIETLVQSSAPSVTAALANADTFSQMLAANAAGIDSFLTGLAETGDQIGPLTEELRLLSTDLRALVEAVPPDAVTASVEGLQETIAGANATFSRIDALVAGNADSLTTTLANAETFSTLLSDNSAGIDAFLTGLGESGDQIGPLTTDLRLLSADLRELVDAVPPETISASVAGLQETIAGANATFSRIDNLVAGNSDSLTATLANAETFSNLLARNSAGIQTFLAGIGEAGLEIGPLTTDLRLLSTDLRELVDAVPPETISASVAGLQETIAGANATFSRIDNLVAGNSDTLTATLANAEAFSNLLARNSAGIQTFLAGIGTAGLEIGPLTEDLRVVSASLRGIAEAVPPEQIAASIGDLQQTIRGANTTFSRIDDLIAGNADSLNATLANAEAFSSTLADNSEGVDRFLVSLTDASDQIGPLAEEVRTLSSDIGAIANAISPEQVAESIDGLQQTIENANATFAGIDALLGTNSDSLTTTLANAEAFSTILAANAQGVDAFLGSLAETSEQIGPLAEELRLLASDVRSLVEVVPPQQVARTFEDVSAFANSLSRNTDNIDAFFVDAGTLAANLSGVSEGLQSTLDLIDEASDAIDADIIANAMENIDAFSVALGRNAENVDQIIGNTRDITDTLTGAAQSIDTIITRVDGLVATEGGESLFTDISAAAVAFRQLAEQLDGRTAEITASISSFANTGLGDFTSLATEARATLQQLQRVLSEIERNPQVVVFGGDTVREFER